MKLSRTLTLVFVLMAVPCALLAQYSPYYFYDSLKDDGVQNQEHLNNIGKIFMDVYPDELAVKDASGIETMPANAWLSARIYLKRSLKYSYTQYMFDSTCNKKDWDFTNYKPNVKYPKHWYQTTSLAFFVCVLVCNGDTVTAWRHVVRNNEFTSKTAFEIKLWHANLSGSDETYYYPLIDYIAKKKLTGTHEISMHVYAGKIQCNKVADRGPECLASGKIKLQISEDDLKKILDQKNAKVDKFPTCEGDNNLVKLEKLK